MTCVLESYVNQKALSHCFSTLLFNHHLEGGGLDLCSKIKYLKFEVAVLSMRFRLAGRKFSKCAFSVL